MASTSQLLVAVGKGYGKDLRWFGALQFMFYKTLDLSPVIRNSFTLELTRKRYVEFIKLNVQ